MIKSNKFPKITIIIPVKKINRLVRRAVPYLLTLDYPNYEILIVTDEAQDSPWENIKIVASGGVGPAKKRDLAEKHSTGEILAFIDDDAYPRSDWLKNAVNHFNKQNVAAVCGPGINPPYRGLLEKAAGAVSESKLCWGNVTFRNKSEGIVREVDDFITANLLVRRSDYKAINGFSSAFWPGEDTSFCLNIVKQLDKKILYDPQVIVYHHRRLPGRPYLEQVGAYGLHRGFFAKKFPATSLRLAYFVPSVFVIGGLGGIGGLGLKLLRPDFSPLLVNVVVGTFLVALLTYLFLVGYEFFKTWFKHKNLWLALLVPPGIFSVHVIYGIQFLRGLFKNELVSKLRK